MGVSNEQQKFIDATGKVILCACPGSGKTYTVAHKLALYLKNWNQSHKGIAALSFTNIASEEIQKQVKSISSIDISYPHFIGTIDSFLNQYIFLRYAHLLTGQVKRPYLSQSNIEMNFRWWKTECHRNGCVKQIEQFRWSVDGNTYKNSNLVNCDEGIHGRPCDQYKNLLIKKGIFFQNDVSYICREILKEFPQIAKALSERFPIILLDEAQDTSKEQMEVMDLLSNSGVKTFCIVGDPDQSIYEWRNASASCFLNKIEDKNWETLYLNENRRSSQAICNATKYFSKILEAKTANIAVGDDKNFHQKPELILIKKDTCKEDVFKYFLDRCVCLNIEHNYKNIAILTRGRIHQNTDVKQLWRSLEIEMLAKATYQWHYGSRKEAYNLCFRSLYLMFVGELYDSKSGLEFEIEKKISLDMWKDTCLNLVCNLPSSEIALLVWVDHIKNLLKELEFPLPFRDGHSVADVIKIKSRDTNIPDFKSFPLKYYFQKKIETDVTISSIHGVKGETFEAILLYAPSTTGSTITRKNLTTGDLENEHNRAAYVAMTRPRKYLAIALKKPSSKSELPLNRFPPEIWRYTEI
ncbi:MAG: ATP-dependent helicase [Epulopiscium sp.]|nr:ATP-dependent helicase [Candidatus Epulonipiscium sp.]